MASMEAMIPKTMAMTISELRLVVMLEEDELEVVFEVVGREKLCSVLRLFWSGKGGMFAIGQGDAVVGERVDLGVQSIYDLRGLLRVGRNT